MTTAVMYNSEGMITGVRSGNSRGVLADAEASGQSYLLTDDDVDLDRFYKNVGTSEVVQYPEKPSEAHVFNFTSYVWELDLTEANRSLGSVLSGIETQKNSAHLSGTHTRSSAMSAASLGL